MHSKNRNVTRVLCSVAAVAMLAMTIACDDNDTQPSSETITFNAQLSPANETPPVTNAEASGSGTAVITLRVQRDSGGAITGATADFQVNLTGFPATTSITMAHIHQGNVGVAGNIVVDTGITTGQVVLAAGAGSFTRTGIAVTNAIAQQMISNPAGFYFNVHSTLNPNGVVRGQLVRQ